MLVKLCILSLFPTHLINVCKDFPKHNLVLHICHFPIKKIKNVQKWWISFPSSLFYILVQISLKPKQKKQSYIVMHENFNKNVNENMFFHSHFYANFHVVLKGN